MAESPGRGVLRIAHGYREAGDGPQDEHTPLPDGTGRFRMAAGYRERDAEAAREAAEAARDEGGATE
jgi:hypothetical protein